MALSMFVPAKRIALQSCAAVAVVWAGCGDPAIDLPAREVSTSSHFRYVARTDDSEVCAGVVDNLEAHFAMLHAYLGIEWTGGTITYYKYRDAADLAHNSSCSQSANACAAVGAIYSPRVLDEHELVHVYVRQLGRPPAMFEEGLAEALSPKGRTFPAPTQTWQEVLRASPPSPGAAAQIAYWGGGWFVAHLLRHHGVQAFLTLYAALPATAAEAQVAAVFQQAYGTSLDDEWQRAQDEDADEKGLPLWECTADALALGGAAADLSERCDGRGSFATFELGQETSLAWYDDVLSSGFNVASCDPDSALHVEQIGWTGELETGALSLPAGRYYVAPMTGVGTLGLRIAANAIAASCGDAAPIVLPSTSSNLTLAIANSSDARYVTLHDPDKASFELARQWDNPIVPDVMAATVEVCAACSGACVPFDNSVATTISDGQMLRLTGLAAPAGATVIRFGYQ